MNEWLIRLSNPAGFDPRSITENEWLHCAASIALRVFVPFFNVSRRKVQLFKCACCRQVWHLMKDARCRNAVEVAERFADGHASSLDLRNAETGVRAALASIDRAATEELPGRLTHDLTLSALGCVCEMPDGEDVGEGVVQTVSYCMGHGEELDYIMQVEEWELVVAEGEKTLMGLYRDIAGNPFRPVTLNLAWRTSAVVNLAQAIYDDRASSVCRSWPTPWRTPAAITRTSWRTAADRGRTCAAAGSLIC